MPTPAPPQFRLGPLAAAFVEGSTRWKSTRGTRRLFDSDASLFTDSGEDRWMGWLKASDTARRQIDRWNALRSEIVTEGITDIVVMGMGGSSLCPDVLQKTFEPQPGNPRLRVLDSTVPEQIRQIETSLSLAHTLFLVPSKSGSTLEPEVLKRYFLDATSRALGKSARGAHFIAITDPGSDLEADAQREGFRYIAQGEPSIGGRFSALSVFGMLPAALLGLDVADLLDRADAMRAASRIGPEIDANPAVSLGVALGEAARHGRNKLTFVLPPGIRALGSWLEQLLAESTGKSGRGILPIDGEELSEPRVYGDDRIFLQMHLDPEPNPAQDAAVAALEAAGHPVIRIRLAEKADLAGEFFRFEVATAVASAVLGVNPFDQPDVEGAKIAARERMSRFDAAGALPQTPPLIEENGTQLYADSELVIPTDGNLRDALTAHFSRLRPGDYMAINAFLSMDENTAEPLERLRVAARNAFGIATTLGFGPRFLHSTGQFHKGGPTTGVFLEVTADDPITVEIPGLPFDFGTLKQAQADGDFQVLCERGQRAIRVHLATSTPQSLATFIETALQALEDAKPEVKGETRE